MHKRLRTLRALYFLVFLVSGLAAFHTVPVDANQRSVAATVPMRGVFYNLTARMGGTVTVDLDLQPETATGYMNFTQLPGGRSVLCGAGTFAGPRTVTGVRATFVSSDPDPGCGFDKNAIFTITAPPETSVTHFWGEYEAKNANGSSLLEAPGVFEVWPVDNQPERVPYFGTFVNTTVNAGGPVALKLVLGINTVSGFINFTNEPGQSTLCGAGEFTGVRRSDDSVQFSFVSDDTDQGCRGNQGTPFTLEGRLSNDGTSMSGTYHVGGTQTGTFHVMRATSVYLPILQR